MAGFRAVVFFICCLFLQGPAAVRAAAPAEAGSSPVWQDLEPGLELGRTVINVQASADSSMPGQLFTARTVILRIDPAYFDFSLYMASQSGLKTLGEIGAGKNLVAAVNAGMYLPDRITSTGYLRNGAHTNNARVGANFGAFFVAGPYERGLPQAQLLDRTRDNWQPTLPKYRLVMQNYRMTTPEGRVIWKQSDRPHSIAALSQDARGHVLFLLCPDPVPAGDFIAALLELPLGIKTVMYLEGGSEAAMLVKAGKIDTVEAGRHITGFWSGGAGLVLPNVLCVHRRAGN